MIPHLLLMFVRDTARTSWVGLFFVILEMVQSVMDKCLTTLFEPLTSLSRTRVDNAFRGLSIRKRFQLHSDIISNIDSEDLSTISTEDVESVKDLAEAVQEILAIPVEIMTSVMTVRRMFNGTMKWAIITSLLTKPLSTILSPKQREERRNTRKSRNSFDKAMNNLHTNIKTIKINGWEDTIQKKLLSLFDKVSETNDSKLVQRVLSESSYFLEEGLILTSLFVENMNRGVTLDVLSLDNTLNNVRSITSTLMSVFSCAKSVYELIQAVTRFEAYLNASEAESQQTVDGRACVLFGQEWKGLTVSEKKQRLEEYDPGIAIEMSSCTLGYRLKKEQPESSPEHSDTDIIDPSLSPTDSSPSSPMISTEKNNNSSRTSLIRRIIRSIWLGIKEYIFEDLLSSHFGNDSDIKLDHSCLQLSSLDFVPLLGKTSSRSASPSYQRRSASPGPAIRSTRHPSPPPPVAPIRGRTFPLTPPPLVGPSLSQSIVAPVAAGPNRTPSPSAVSTRTTRSAFLGPVSFSLRVRHGEHHSLLGTVGSGKSLLLSTLAGQSDVFAGSGHLAGKVIYMPQDPLILNSSIRHNILFGSKWNKAIYEQVLKACCFEKDLDEMNQGDRTIVGRWGRKLSGGQRQRMTLARLCYSILIERNELEKRENAQSEENNLDSVKPSNYQLSQSHVVLLDDPTSACDVKVARLIEENVLRGILKNETVLLATHNRPLARRFGKMHTINEGRIEDVWVEEGEEMEERGGNLDTIDSDGKDEGINEGKKESCTGKSEEETKTTESDIDPTETTEDPNNDDSEDDSDTESELDADELPFIKPKLSLETMKYLMKYFSFGLAVLMYVVDFSSTWLDHQQGLLTEEGEEAKESLMTNTTLSGTNSTSSPSTTLPTHSRVFTARELILFFVYGFVSVLLDCSSGAIRDSMSRANIREMTDRLLTIVLDTPLHVFLAHEQDISYALSGDLYTLTNPSSNPLFLFLERLRPVLVDVISLLIRAKDFRRMYLFFIGVGIASEVKNHIEYKLAQRKNNAELEKLNLEELLDEDDEDEVTNLFRLSVEDVIEAGPTIRQMGREDLFFHLVADSYDQQAIDRVYSSDWEWQSLTSDVLDWMKTVIVWWFCVDVKKKSGKGISYQSASTSSRTAQRVCSRITSAYGAIDRSLDALGRVRRVEGLAQENAHLRGEREEEGKSEEWTKIASVEFEDVRVRYTKRGQDILKGVSFSVPAGKRVGVVGRTGCGKSTLMLSLLNLMVRTSGDIRVGGKSVTDINTRTLRQHIAVVQQEVMLANETLRDCIDPYTLYTDEVLLDALERVGIREDVEALPLSLNTPLTDTSKLLSAGQRQLLGIARALLKQAQIVLLDEPSSNVDEDTDEEVQHVMREAWGDATVLIVAHRLNTVADSDLVIVMDAGTIIEMGPTNVLLHTPGSQLQTLALNSGPAFLTHLQNISDAAQIGTSQSSPQ
ncbi:Multidrug resistance-associated protein [Blattamonas nauphoetae]|uniref:Multidrug resistance-associated protein n=1 Tax=Blattamonas nauphoetae TaxID=2049346 RepID=A0ABQ9XZ14_9EUKA|nr:Multidrug resistance-associated protein [Blattamonas nauphoetae]